MSSQNILQCNIQMLEIIMEIILFLIGIVSDYDYLSIK